MFANLSIAQRVALYLGLTVALQVHVIAGVLTGMSAGWLIGGSLVLGGLIAFIYIDGAKSTGDFLRDLMGGGDPAASKRVAEAMLKMVKIDIAGLEAAARGG